MASARDAIIDKALRGLADDGRKARIARVLSPEQRETLLKAYGFTSAAQAPTTGAPASPPPGVTPDGNR